MLNPIQAVGSCLRNWHNFSGRARRSEYWWTYLVFTAVYFVLMIFDFVIFGGENSPGYPYPGLMGGVQNWLDDAKIMPISTGFYYIALFPLIAMGIRRMHDVGRSGWWFGLATLATEMSMPYGESTVSTIVSRLLSEDPNGELLMFGVGGAVLILIILNVIVFIFSVLNSDPEPNKYGPSPKAAPMDVFS